MQICVFQRDNSQVVRIPADFRFDVGVVEILGVNSSDVTLRPARQSSESFLTLFDGFDDTFIEAFPGVVIYRHRSVKIYLLDSNIII
ncbi:virulence-associated protein VagC [Cricetibacter osteomyelitidis]|uniref:Virulence-associated protein VagC n=1 Tax=Cricetibacter osteomyelitidis TaxID=1521931 RepID=A0A4R2T6K7_9PAST|nr:AbrB/MazE/SpoVT family DNA-binding domain-containing protein [Cricetibacter osteomyelitidis]TCP97261.1 virulence-associated protein VagC [Cricetibacter osteomyelitidis]